MENYFNIADTIQEFNEDCAIKGLARRTIICYDSHLRIWKAFLKQRGIQDFSELTKQSLLDYRLYLYSSYRCPKGNPISVRSQAQKLTALRSFLVYAVTKGKSIYDGSHELKDPKVPKTLPRNVLSKQQVKKILLAPDINTPKGYRDRVIFEIFYSTGIRRNELASILLEDLLLKERLLFIRTGKGDSQRWIPLGKQVCSILTEYIHHVRPALVKNKQHNTLIVGDFGSPIYPERIHDIVKKYFQKLGLPSSCHSFRHSFATHMLKGKANLREIQSLLGHKSLAATQIYTHVDISDLTKTIQKSHPRETMLCEEK